MNKYGQTALKAVQNFKDSYSITEIYARAAKEVFLTQKGHIPNRFISNDSLCN